MSDTKQQNPPDPVEMLYIESPSITLKQFREAIDRLVTEACLQEFKTMWNKTQPDITVSIMGQNKTLPCSDLADGCIGVSLWFDTMENAVAYGENDSNKDLMIVFDAPQKKESKV